MRHLPWWWELLTFVAVWLMNFGLLVMADWMVKRGDSRRYLMMRALALSITAFIIIYVVRSSS